MSLGFRVQKKCSIPVLIVIKKGQHSVPCHVIVNTQSRVPENFLASNGDAPGSYRQEVGE